MTVPETLSSEDYRPVTLADVYRACTARSMSYAEGCREVKRITGAHVSTSDARSHGRDGGRLSNPMRGLWGLFFINHDLTIYGGTAA